MTIKMLDKDTFQKFDELLQLKRYWKGRT